MESIKLNNKIPKELLQVVKTGEFEDDGGALITSIDYYTDDLKLEIKFNTGNENIENQFWEIQIENCREQKIDFNWSFELNIYSKHFLLAPFLEPHFDLYIKSKAPNPEKLFYDIYQYHNSFDKNRNINTFFNNVQSDLLQTCEMDFGLVAKGPESYMKDYKMIFEKHETSPYLTNKVNPKRWYKNHWVAEKKHLELLEVGNSFFIAESITFNRV